MNVTMPWTWELPMQQQSVLLLACRGPDGVAKYHACKDVVRAYRGCVLQAAKYGRPLHWGEAADTFMSLNMIAHDTGWPVAVRNFFDVVDEVPHHYYLHLAHGAEILAYRHPDKRARDKWFHFYTSACDDMHLKPEAVTEMNVRLGDWGQEFWD